jgi:hypothetical protein
MSGRCHEDVPLYKSPWTTTDKEDDISSYNIQVDVISIQETWSFYYPEMVHLPGFQPIIFSGRSGMRGGVVLVFIYVRGCTSTD